jgi:hypothetical protein
MLDGRNYISWNATAQRDNFYQDSTAVGTKLLLLSDSATGAFGQDKKYFGPNPKLIFNSPRNVRVQTFRHSVVN